MATAAVTTPITAPLPCSDTKRGVTPNSPSSPKNHPEITRNSTGGSLVCALQEFIKQTARDQVPTPDGYENTDMNSADHCRGMISDGSKVVRSENAERLGVRWGSAASATPLSSPSPPRELQQRQDPVMSFQGDKAMIGSPPSTPESSSPISGDQQGPAASGYSVSTMLQSLRSNLSQMYSSGEIMDGVGQYAMKTELPYDSSRRSDQFRSRDTTNFSDPQYRNGDNIDPLSIIDDTYNNTFPSSVQSSVQRQFLSSTGLNNQLFSSQDSYSSTNYTVKPEPSSPAATDSGYFYAHQNPATSSSSGPTPTSSVGGPTSVTGGGGYQGAGEQHVGSIVPYRLSNMMTPCFTSSQNSCKQDRYQQLSDQNSPTHGLSSTDHGLAHDYQRRAVPHGGAPGPVRLKRVMKRPLPTAGPSYPVHLWQFILELLGNYTCKDFITWTGNDLEFKVLNSGMLAKRWGRRKNNSRMNFDKLSRAMRYYYEKNIIKHIPGQRLLYTFCRNPDDIVFTELLKTAMATLPPETRLIAPVTISPHLTSLHAGLSEFSPAMMTDHLSFPDVTCTPSLVQNQMSPLGQSDSPPSSGIMGSESSHPIDSGINQLSSSLGLDTCLGPQLHTPRQTMSPQLGELFTGSDHDNLSDYMFSSLTQVQCHISSDDGTAKQHMMAS